MRETAAAVTDTREIAAVGTEVHEVVLANLGPESAPLPGMRRKRQQLTRRLVTAGTVTLTATAKEKKTDTRAPRRTGTTARIERKRQTRTRKFRAESVQWIVRRMRRERGPLSLRETTRGLGARIDRSLGPIGTETGTGIIGDPDGPKK
jgi:hypothetical protein